MSVHELKLERNEAIVEACGQLLDLAERGKLRGIAFAAELEDRAVWTFFDGPDLFALIGMLDMVRSRILSDVLAETRDGKPEA